MNTKRVRVIGSDGMVRTIAGSDIWGYADNVDPLKAQFYGMEGCDVAKDGSYLFIADGDTVQKLPYHRIRRLALG